MLATTNSIIQSGLGEHAFTEIDLHALFGGSDQRRYGLVNKALSKGELIRLRRGVYILNESYAPVTFSKFYLACKIITHSYISFEAALSYHGLIPERVEEVSCVVPFGRNRSYKNKLGVFSYHIVPYNNYEFLTQVKRELINDQPFFVASAVRALADLIYTRKISRNYIDYLIHSLRINVKYLQSQNSDDIDELLNVYRNKRVLSFLNRLKEVIQNV